MKAVIIEDEKPAARLLHSMLQQLRPEWKIEFVDGSIQAACEWFGQNPHPDIIFLDIQLSDGNSFLFLEQAKPQSLIIFTTAYDEYALNAFSVNSIDYILKPIKQERLEEAIVKFEGIAGKENYNDVENIVDALKQMYSNEKKYRTRFLISGFKGFTKLEVDDIAYFYLENKIVFAVTFAGTEHIIDISLDKLIEQLNPDQFFRANRQTIINIRSIDKIDHWFGGKALVVTQPKSKTQIIVSRERVSLLKIWLNY